MSNNTNDSPNGWISARQEEINELRETIPGIDENGRFIRGSEIETKYDGYKVAENNHANANRNYKTTAKIKEAKRPYNAPIAAVAGRQFYLDGHETLAPLAMTAADAATTHADLRASFTRQYEPLYAFHGNLAGHVKQAEDVKKGAQRHQNNAAAHIAAAQLLGGNNNANQNTTNQSTADQNTANYNMPNHNMYDQNTAGQNMSYQGGQDTW